LKRRCVGILLAAALASAVPAAAVTETETISAASATHLRVLETARDREALERAGRSLASSGEPAALRALGRWLRRPDFLARLDDLHDPPSKTYHLGRVLGALEGHPSAATEALCLQLLQSPDFMSDPDRKVDLLPALGAVRPMSEEGAEAFLQASAEGYASQNLPLLVRNGSPRALVLFEAMVRDRQRDPEVRVADIHTALLPRRTDLQVLRSVERLLAASDLEEPIAIGLIETVFDYQSRRWFGPARNPPAPPPWSGASPAVAKLVVTLAAKARTRTSLSPALRAAINATTAEVLRSRGSTR
jgi:hypothetical protein